MTEADWYPKREARQFEPPPWERDQFEALQQRREQDAPAAAPEQPAGEEQPSPEAASESEELVIVPGPELAPRLKVEKAKPAAVPDAEVDAMLAALQAQEPAVDEHLKPVTVFASAIAMLLGVSMFAWGLFAMMRSQKTMVTMIGALIVLGMGVVFGATGFWAGWRATNKQEEK
jgi:hypothetical protein